MRILHTSDWHIGRTFHGNNTLDALREVLAALVQQVREHRVDVVLVAGDVFDSSTPQALAYSLLSSTLGDIVAAGASVVVTSGNHDNAARLGFQSALLRPEITVITDPARIDEPVTFADEFGEVDVYGIPYLEPSIVRTRWEGHVLRTQEQVMTHAMQLVRDQIARRGRRSVAMAHCFTAGVEATPGVEREVRQGTLDVVPIAAFDGPDYVALGHIHGRQTLQDRVRYSGAPLHYSFGEQAKPRGSWLVELDATGLADVRWLDLPVPRALQTLRGAFEDVLHSPAFAEAEAKWVSVEYTDPTPVRDPMRQLLRRFPHCAAVAHTPDAVPERSQQSYTERLRGAVSDEDRVAAFLEHVRAGEGPNELERELLREVTGELKRREASK